MKVFVDINHPAHVHFFKNLVWDMHDRGHDFFISSRDKEVALDLLDAYDIEYFNRGRGYSGVVGKSWGILDIDYKLYRHAKKFKPDVFLGLHNTYTAHLGKLMGKPSITFTDTEHARLANFMTFPFTDVICTPTCFMKDLGGKHVKYEGYHELAYLHPDRFKPDQSVLDDVGVGVNEKFFILRFVSWGASHDRGQSGFGLDEGKHLIEGLSDYGRVFVISEDRRPDLDEYRLDIAPERIHDLLHYATMYIGEGATMASEAACLGTPAVYVNTLTLGYLEEQEKRYGLTYNFRKSNAAIKKVFELLEKNNLKSEWRNKRDKMLADKVDVTSWMVEFIEKYKT